MQPIIVHGHDAGPNPWKVIIFLEELSLPYEHIIVDFSALKQPAYESINPNGRVPSIQDPNNSITVFESGAIIDYLLETYDTTGLFALPDPQQKWLARGLRDFQMSGQGPYTGQRIWFTKYHSEKIPSAVERYANEVKRMIGVLEKQLARTGTGYLVGEKCAYADLMFIPWYLALDATVPEGTDVGKEFPLFEGWLKTIMARPAVGRMLEIRKEALERKRG